MDAGTVVLTLSSTLALGLSALALRDLRRAHPRVTSLTVLYGLLALIPVLGPLAYFWLAKAPTEAAGHLQNHGPPGRYLHDFLSLRHLYADAIVKIREKAERRGRGAEGACEEGAAESDPERDPAPGKST